MKSTGVFERGPSNRAVCTCQTGAIFRLRDRSIDARGGLIRNKRTRHLRGKRHARTAGDRLFLSPKRWDLRFALNASLVIETSGIQQIKMISPLALSETLLERSLLAFTLPLATGQPGAGQGSGKRFPTCDPSRPRAGLLRNQDGSDAKLPGCRPRWWILHSRPRPRN